MTEAEAQAKENPFHSKLVFGGKLAGSALGGYIAMKVLPPFFWFIARKFHPSIRIPIRAHSPTNKEFGRVVLMAGVLTRNPYVIGSGAGMFFSNTDNGKLRKQQWTASKNEKPKELNMIRYSIPDYLPWSIKYAMLGDILLELIIKPTWNEEKKKYIPPGREHPDIINKAREIAKMNNLDGHDKIAVLRAIQAWVQDNINYVYDPRWLDVFSHPYITLKKGIEDCDGHALLVAALGEALGIPMALALVGQLSKDHFNHIMAAGLIDGKLVPIETIPIQGKKAEFGWIAPHLHKKVIPIP